MTYVQKVLYFPKETHIKWIIRNTILPVREGVILQSHVLRINNAHLKHRIEKDYLLERDLASRGFVLCLILAVPILQLDVNRITLEDSYYDRIFKETYGITDIPLLLQYVGVNEQDLPTLIASHMEYLVEFLSMRFNPRLKNFLSVSYDSGYFLNIHLKQTR